MDEVIELHYDRLRLNDDEFYEFCQQNDNLRFEREPNGTILVMSNTGGESGARNAEIMFQLMAWQKQTKQGRIFDSSTAFRLPSTAVRSADAAFVTNDRWQALTDEQRKKFPPLYPDFIVELRSSTDSVPALQRKIQDDWLAAGCRLAWLIDAEAELVYIYRADGSVQILKSFDEPLTGEDVLPGLAFTLSDLRLS
ncbi:Uma2 family endonuclease [Fibrella aquatica]|uniref:Uma2 family endonuclease n=1 Tax=Fibrella aquatica TaxID=3242487 RepID=UPI0035218FC1